VNGVKCRVLLYFEGILCILFPEFNDAEEDDVGGGWMVVRLSGLQDE